MLLRNFALLNSRAGTISSRAVICQARNLAAAGRGAGKGGSGRDGEYGGDSDATATSDAAAAAIKEKDPFGFRELKAKWKNSEIGGHGSPDMREEDAEAIETEIEKTGRVTVPRNIFGIKHISKEMTEAWEEGLLPPQLYPRAAGLEGPPDFYWPSNLETALPDESDRLYPAGGERVFSPEEVRAMNEAEVGGVCRGKLQRRGNQPLLCKKIDLGELEFSNVAVLAQFVSPLGMIKPRRMSGLCAKCQRKVARTIKQARHLGVLPHTYGVDLYQRLKMKGEGVGSDGKKPFLWRKGDAVEEREKKREELLKQTPSLTI